jgi:hypothetical protein
MSVGDVIRFEVQSDHNVMLVHDYDGTTTCSFGTLLTNDVETYEYAFNATGTYYFYCSNGNHCEEGMHKTVTILARGVGYNEAPVGNYNDPYDSMEVKDCATGTYQDHAGQTSCKAMSTCGGGQKVADLVEDRTEDRRCVPCPVGTYSEGSNALGCQRCPGGMKPNGNRSGCVEEDDEDEVPLWVILLLGVGLPAVILFVGVAVYATRPQRRGGGDPQKASLIRGMVF